MPEAFTVSELNEFLKISFDQSQILKDIYIKGEISNFTNHYKTGHYYFTIKDDSSALKAVMFRMYTNMLDFVPENGMKIIAHGKIDIFVRDGTYSLKVDDIIPDGVGSLYISYEKLKNKLEAEGLFDQENKKSIPSFPQKIGVITSPTGAVIQDIKNVASRRFPLCEIVLFPCAVQGKEAPLQIIEGLRYFEQSQVDIVIIARGGGSLEDLMPFNDEKLAREIYLCQKPIISAVGHETDYTICDFVSDLRAPTPSAAAELALPSSEDISAKLSHIKYILDYSVSNVLNKKKDQLESISNNYLLQKPFAMLDKTQVLINNLFEKLHDSINNSLQEKKALVDKMSPQIAFARSLEKKQHKFSTLAVKLEALSPLAVMKRGYSVVLKDDRVISNIKDLKANDIINIRMKDGSLKAEVQIVEQDKF